MKNKYDELYEYLPSNIILYPKEYKSNYDLRKYLLDKKRFKLIDNTFIKIEQKKVNFINEEKLAKLYPPPKNENELEALRIPTKKNKCFYKGEKAKEAKNFFQLFDYDSSNNVQKAKFGEELINSYLKIIEN